jgi:S-DNA-T family DNA segregation ATPase FtsK/SpoIIIE
MPNFFTAEQPDLNSVVVPIQPVSPKVRRANQHAKNHINTSANPQRSLPTATAQSADPRAPQAIADANSIGSNLIEILNSFGIGATYQGSILAPAFIRVKLKPNPGVKVNSLLKLSDDLRVQLGLTHPPLIAPQAGYVSVDLPRTDRQVAQFEQ